MASGIYNRFKANLMNKVVDLEADTIKVMLMDSNHTFVASELVITAVSDNETSGNEYTAGGKALTFKSVTEAATTKWDASDIVWGTASDLATFDANYAVLYDASAGASDLICSIDFAGKESVVAGTFTIQWNANGIITLA